MKLHYAPGTISVASALTLLEAGLDFDLIRVDFAAAEQTGEAYGRVNPKRRVPALETEGGILTENGAIQEYIASCAPEAGLVPADAFAAARMREIMYYLASTMHVNHAHRMRGSRWADQEASHADMAAKVPETMTASCQFIEDHALEGPFLLGEQISLADLYLFVICTWLKGDGVDVSQFPKLEAFTARMQDRPSVIRAREMGILPGKKK